MALFLSALDLDAQVKFSQWVQEHLGVRVHLENEGQWSVSVKLEEKGRTFNLIDAGYGYSQLLPVLLQCWASSSGLSPAGSAPAPSFLAIEQPELHLHPAHQARLADVFVASFDAIQSGGNRLQLLIETHSDALINRLGELVEQRICNRQDVSVVLFEKDENSGDTKVTVSEFDDRGYLQNWPIGFFAP